MDDSRKPGSEDRGDMVPGLPVIVPPRTLSDMLPNEPQDSDETAWHFGRKPEEEPQEAELVTSGAGRYLLGRLIHRG